MDVMNLNYGRDESRPYNYLITFNNSSAATFS